MILHTVRYNSFNIRSAMSASGVETMTTPERLQENLPSHESRSTLRDMAPFFLVLLIALALFVMRWASPPQNIPVPMHSINPSAR